MQSERVAVPGFPGSEAEPTIDSFKTNKTPVKAAQIKFDNISTRKDEWAYNKGTATGMLEIFPWWQSGHTAEVFNSIPLKPSKKNLEKISVVDAV